MVRTRNLKNAFTLVELLLVLSIIGVLAALLLSAMSNFRLNAGKTYYQTQQTGVYQCVKTYVTQHGHPVQSRKWVNLRPEAGGEVEVFEVENDYYAKIYNSDQLYAQFEPQRWYIVESVGFYEAKAYVPLYPRIKSVKLKP